MKFKELKKGFPVYILNKDTIEYSQGKVIQDATPPRISNITMVVDVSIEQSGTTKIWTLGSDLEVAQTDNTFISTDKNIIVTMLKSMQQEYDNYLKGVENVKDKLSKVNKLVGELDVTYKQQQQTEARFSRIEDSIKVMESTLSEILKAVK